MKRDFKNLAQQMTYINKFIQRKTNLSKNCQICGKPGKIQHNQVDPYKIRILCNECRIKNNLLGRTVDQVISDIPIINALDYLISPSKILKYRDITEEEKRIINKTVKFHNKTKTELCRDLGISVATLPKLLEKYEIIKPGITEQLNEAIKTRQREILLQSALKRQSDTSNYNKFLLNYKKQNNYSTEDLVELCDNQISKLTLNLIIEGKQIPNDKYKKIIADSLNKSVEEIFGK